MSKPLNSAGRYSQLGNFKKRPTDEEIKESLVGDNPAGKLYWEMIQQWKKQKLSKLISAKN